jgi:hypothetical protein
MEVFLLRQAKKLSNLSYRVPFGMPLKKETSMEEYKDYSLEDNLFGKMVHAIFQQKKTEVLCGLY